jgi:hypothetical protein
MTDTAHLCRTCGYFHDTTGSCPYWQRDDCICGATVAQGCVIHDADALEQLAGHTLSAIGKILGA